jgi:uncharacterized membrane protein
MEDFKGDEIMNTKQWVGGTVGGAVVLFVVGYVIFELLLSDFYASNSGTATDVMRETQIIWAVAVGALAYAALILYAMRGNAATLDVGSGAKVGATVGFLIWACADFTLYGISNINTLTLAIVDPLAELVRGGITGAAVAMLVRKLA